ncbi:interleukin-1 receptor type 2-like [Rhinoraja longicauda]
MHQPQPQPQPQPGPSRHLGIPLLMLLLLHYLMPTRAAERVQGQGFTNCRPRIIRLRSKPGVAKLGKTLQLTCRANSGGGRDYPTMIYWLANNQFIEECYVDGRVAEGKERSWTRNERLIVQKSLKFTSTLPEDFGVNFTCIVLTPKGTSWQNIILESKLAEVDNSLKKGRC